jgi:type I restriction enzyme S subunit
VSDHPQDKRLSSLIAGIQAGVSPLCDVATPQDDEFGVLTLAAVTSGHIHPSAAKRIASERVQPEWPVVRRGTVLVTRASGSRKLVGACALVEKDEPRLIVPDKVWVLEFAKSRSGRVLVEFLRSWHGRKAIHRIMRGSSGMWNISQESFLSVHVASLSGEAEDIIDRLSVAFDAVAQRLASLVAAKRCFKRGVAQQLLSGQRRFPQFAGDKWKTVTLGEVLTYSPRKVRKPVGTFLSAGVRSHGKGVFLKEDFPADGIALEELFVLRELDLVVNITFGWEGAIAIVPPTADGALVSHRFPTYEIDRTEASAEYFRYLIQTKRFVFDVACASPGGAGRNRVLNRREFLEIPVRLPSRPEQEAIAALLDALAREIELLERLHDAIASQKRALMSRLLCGENSVPV